MAVDTRERLLDVAERHFAERGFHGASVRKIAADAGIRASLVHYHFESKADLYRAVFERRLLAVNQVRMRKLDEIQSAGVRGAEHEAEAIVRSLIEPALQMSRDDKIGVYYAQMVAQLTNDPQEHVRRISREFTDPIARMTIRTLSQALPHLEEEEIVWCYMFAVGAMTNTMSRNGRVSDLSNGRCDPRDIETILDLFVPFVVGGMAAVGAHKRKHSVGNGNMPRRPAARPRANARVASSRRGRG